ncbi:MAG: alpha/beta hydrolase [Vicingaceae bacterium]
MAKINRTLNFRGSQFAYKVKGSGRAILLIHGFLGTQEVWNTYFDRLSTHFKVISLDLPGHGKSQNLGYVHEMGLMANLVYALLKELNIRKAVIAGHSLGGYVGLAFAELFPDHVLGLILVNSTAKGDSKAKINSRNQLISLLKKDQKRPLELLVPNFFNVINRKTGYFRRRYLNMAFKANHAGILATIEGMKIRKEREIVLKFAPFPYLHLIGEHDKLLATKDLMEEAELNDKGYAILFKESSHMLLWEEEEKCYKQIKHFTKNLYRSNH